MEQSQEYLKREFLHYVSDTISLLGGSEEIIKKIRQCEEKPLTSQLIDEIKGYNMSQIDSVKTRLALLNVTEIRVTD